MDKNFKKEGENIENMKNEDVQVESQKCECESNVEDVGSSNRECELLEHIQRLQAEFENYRKRTDKERSNICKNANEELIVKLLGILDNFELALQHNEDKGVSMIFSELYSTLEKEGLSVISTEGKFDPMFHEVLIQEDGEGDGMIIEELQKGYKLNDKVIRVSKVKTSKVKEVFSSDESLNAEQGDKNE
jgi:molecular chaperone GrpE